MSKFAKALECLATDFGTCSLWMFVNKALKKDYQALAEKVSHQMIWSIFQTQIKGKDNIKIQFGNGQGKSA